LGSFIIWEEHFSNYTVNLGDQILDCLMSAAFLGQLHSRWDGANWGLWSLAWTSSDVGQQEALWLHT